MTKEKNRSEIETRRESLEKKITYHTEMRDKFVKELEDFDAFIDGGAKEEGK